MILSGDMEMIYIYDILLIISENLNTHMQVHSGGLGYIEIISLVADHIKQGEKTIKLRISEARTYY